MLPMMIHRSLSCRTLVLGDVTRELRLVMQRARACFVNTTIVAFARVYFFAEKFESAVGKRSCFCDIFPRENPKTTNVRRIMSFKNNAINMAYVIDVGKIYVVLALLIATCVPTCYPTLLHCCF